LASLVHTDPLAPHMAASELQDIGHALRAAERFYLGCLDGSWAADYLVARGFDRATARRWRIGYAFGGWTTVTAHLRRHGFTDGTIRAAGLARLSSRGALIDHFRDRVMLPIRDERGILVAFIGRARPDAGPVVPKYLNSPETAAYTKGNILFGLHESRRCLARGATPVIVEGPFDAIAVTVASPGRYAGLAPCGTALTARQVEAMARVADLDQAGVLVALDGDAAGQRATIKAYQVLLTVTSRMTAAILPGGRDPAQILQEDGAAALVGALGLSKPLAEVIVDAHIERWVPQLARAEGHLHAMRSAARLVASLLPVESTWQIIGITGGHQLAAFDDSLHHLVHPELSAVARALPPGAIGQILRVAERTGYESADIIAEVANSCSEFAEGHRSR
jgi:DNA primase